MNSGRKPQGVWFRRGNRQQWSGGYTIVETLIVLAATSLLFLIAYQAFIGQQRKAQFNQNLRDLDSKLQDIANDINTGFFASANRECTAPVGAGTPSITSTTAEQGTSRACIYLGKAIQFGVDDPDCNTDNCSRIRIVTVIGRRLVAGGTREVQNLEEAAAIPAPDDGFSEFHASTFGFGVWRVLDNNRNEIGGVAFLSTLGNVSNGSLVSGTQSTLMYPVAERPGITREQFNTDVTEFGDQAIASIPTATVCAREGGAGSRQAAIILTDTAAGITTQTLVDSEAEGVCN